jgi:hypothetical protein
MQAVSRKILGLVLTLTILGAPALLAAPAYAGVNPSTTPVGCGLNPDDQGYSSWTSNGTTRTENDSLFCYYIWLDGHFRVGGTYYDISGSWVGGYPSSVSTNGPSGNVETAGQHNACEAGWTGCNGYATTLAYQ